MKKIFLATLVLITLLMLASCDTGSKTPSTTPSSNKTPAHVHTFDEWQTVLEPTCDEKGLEERVCECGEKEEHKLPSLDHVYTPNVTEPTCTEGGYTTYLCVCGKSRIGDYTEKRGHDFTDYVTVTAPTCTTDGEEKISCKNCTFSVSRKISATDHEFGESIELSAPTCTTAGSYKRECKKCSKAEYSSSPALEHSFGDWLVTLAATCTEYGEERRECQNAGCTKYELRYLKYTGHTFGEWVTTSEPTCTGVGEKQSNCINCPEYKTEEIPAKGTHSFGKWATVSEPFCGNIGERVRICTLCNHNQMGIIPAKGSHNYGAWKTETPSTQTRECKNCSATERRRISFSANATVEVAVIAENIYYEGASNKVPYRRQGGCFNGINYYQALITQDETNARIMKKNVITGEISFSELVPMGHANNMRYDPKTNCVYVGNHMFDGDTLEYMGKKRSINFNIASSEETASVSWEPGPVGQGGCSDENYSYFLTCDPLGYDSKYYTFVTITSKEGNYSITVKVEIPENFEPENISVVNGEIYIAACTAQPYATLYRVVFEE